MMEFESPVFDLVRQRSSYRTFKKEPLPPKVVDFFQQAFSRPLEGPFGNQPRFKLVVASPGDSQELKGLGTYGFIQGAQAFIIGAVARGEGDWIDYGYVLESWILKATDLGLQTCWLGGAFSKSSFAAKIGATAGERVPAVTPLGYALPKRRAMDRAIRWAAGSKNRKDLGEICFEADGRSPLPPGDLGAAVRPLEALRLAPSASNKQPWRVLKDQAGFHLFFVPTARYSQPQLQYIDLGIAMAHFELVARETGLKGQWKKRTNPPTAPEALGSYVASF